MSWWFEVLDIKLEKSVGYLKVFVTSFVMAIVVSFVSDLLCGVL